LSGSGAPTRARNDRPGGAAPTARGSWPRRAWRRRLVRDAEAHGERRYPSRPSGSLAPAATALRAPRRPAPL